MAFDYMFCIFHAQYWPSRFFKMYFISLCSILYDTCKTTTQHSYISHDTVNLYFSTINWMTCAKNL